MSRLHSVVVLIPTCRRSELLDRTLTSLGAAGHLEHLQAVYVIENGAQEERTRLVADRHAATLPIQFRNAGSGNKSAALNDVLRELHDDDLVLFFDDDVRVAAGIVQAYYQTAVDADDGYFFGGPTSVDYEQAPPSWLRPYLPPSAAGWQWAGETPLVAAPAFLGFNWAAFVRDLRRAGGFDPNFGPGSATGATGQETTMQTALLRSGCRGLYVDAARVWHYVPRDRCSRRWVLRRALKNGTREGLLVPPSDDPTVLGAPRWMVRLLLEKAGKTLFAQVTSSQAARFAALHELTVWAGKVKGARTRGRQAPR